MEMNFKRISKSFFLQPTLITAKNLLGKYIVRKFGREKIIGKIVETEAYLGPKDKAAHSYGGKITGRNKIVYREGGYVYIYLVYGMYWQLNIVTTEAGKPECVLIRAIEPIVTNLGKTQTRDIHGKLMNIRNLANGPGKLCRWLKLDKSFYGEDLTKSKRIWLEDDGQKIPASRILATGRIGIDYAGPYWSKRKLRFVLKNPIG